MSPTLTAIVIFALLAVIFGQSIATYVAWTRWTSAGEQERRFLINHILADTPSEFAILSTASRPDETVEAVAEARVARSSTPGPLGL